MLLADGGAWIEQRWSTLGLSADVEVVDILDIRHLEEHLHACADAVFGQHTPPAEAWARQMSETVRANGPKPVLQAVDALVPPNPEAAEEVRRLHGHLTANAHRLEYPSFLARKLPIGSGLVEAEVKVVVNQRAKRSGMRWTVPGAQAVLALRALVLSAPACLERFWATHPRTARLPMKLGVQPLYLAMPLTPPRRKTLKTVARVTARGTTALTKAQWWRRLGLRVFGSTQPLRRTVGFSVWMWARCWSWRFVRWGADARPSPLCLIVPKREFHLRDGASPGVWCLCTRAPC